jgi:hypothetical protein
MMVGPKALYSALKLGVVTVAVLVVELELEFVGIVFVV